MDFSTLILQIHCNYRHENEKKKKKVGALVDNYF